MKPSQILELRCMPEHAALHAADVMLTQICSLSRGLIELYALNPLDLDSDTQRVLEAVQRMSEKIKAAHDRVIHGGACH